MRFELSNDNFLMYAMRNYDNPGCSGMTEFMDDLKRIKYLKRLFKKYSYKKELKERLILNHIIVLNNLFGTEAITKMLFFKIDKKFWSQLKTFLVFLNFMPLEVMVSKDVIDIPLDDNITDILRKI
jgi:hypothetical protein